MQDHLKWLLLFVLVVGAGAGYRLARLEDRPMHTDESVHAEKFKALINEGFYVYDPAEYHGPTLNYITLVSAWVRGEKDFSQVDEVTLRVVPAMFGIGLVLTPLFFVKSIGRRAVVISGVLLAFSPAFVFYSRYYIQETLLVFFTACFLGSLWRYWESKEIAWAVVCGVSVGLMWATKETFVFSIASAAGAMVLCVGCGVKFGRAKAGHVIVALAAMLIVGGVLLSSFGANPGGIVDSVRTYSVWGQRAAGNCCHTHPWCYYLDMLTWAEFFEPVCWNEDVIVAMGGIVAVFLFLMRFGKLRENGAFVFLLFYTLILTGVYHVIPYKTPWCVLGFLYGMLLLAGIGLDALLEVEQGRVGKRLTWLFVAAFVVVSPAVQSWFLNFKYYADQTNPYVYGHTSTDIYEMVGAVEKAAVASEYGKEAVVYVVADGDDYWPWPWYLRGYSNVGYSAKVSDEVCGAQIILCDSGSKDEVIETLYGVPAAGEKYLYVPLFDEESELRPKVEWCGMVRKDLYDKMNRAETIEEIIDENVNDEDVIGEPSKSEIENLLKFSHQAMNTNFAIFIQDERGDYAGRAAREAFNEVDRLEGLLSRFVGNSDVSRINALKVGEREIVDIDTFRCLQAAQKAWGLTDGCFDACAGKLIAAYKENGAAAVNQSLYVKGDAFGLVLDEDGFSVGVINDSVSVDVGGIGKGYAVDVIAGVLDEWGIKKVLISAGASTVRALDKPDGKDGWGVTISDPDDGGVLKWLELGNEVLSSSGTKKGEHIIDPSSGLPAKDKRACWVRLKGTAAMADALSTAVMVMDDEAVERLKEKIDGISVVALKH